MQSPKLDYGGQYIRDEPRCQRTPSERGLAENLKPPGLKLTSIVE